MPSPAVPLPRGFARFPGALLTRIGSRIAARLAAHSPRPGESPLICTIPWFASVAEAWPGPVVYWLTDLIAEYESARRKSVGSHAKHATSRWRRRR
jgi:hypothetical protein